jgi:SAM-dependent methyltransferase
MAPPQSPLGKYTYAIARRIVPAVRLQHRLDSMVGPVGYWKELQRYQIDLLKRMGLLPHHRLLDVGCGPLQGGLAFIEYLEPGRYFGVDIRQSAIEEARKQVARARLIEKKPVITISRSFGMDELRGLQFDFIWCCQTMYHLDETLLGSLFEKVSLMLTPDGKFLGDIIGYPNNVADSSCWNGFRFFLHTVESISSKAHGFGLSVQAMGTIEEFGYPREIDLKTNILLLLTNTDT